jgi:excisionase family DNA binding protein
VSQRNWPIVALSTFDVIAKSVVCRYVRNNEGLAAVPVFCGDAKYRRFLPGLLSQKLSQESCRRYFHIPRPEHPKTERYQRDADGIPIAQGRTPLPLCYILVSTSLTGYRRVVMNDLPLVMSVEDVARELRIARGTAYELVHQESFPAIRIGRCIRVPRQAFEKWLESQATGKAS